MPEIHLIVVLFSPKTLEAFFVYILSQHAVNWFCCAQACPVKHEQNQDAMETAPPPFCFWHLNPCKAKSNQEMQHISRIDPGQCFPPRISACAVISDRSLWRDRTISSRLRQVPRHMLALVAQLLSNAKFSHLQLWESVLTCFTTPLRSIKYLHVPLELRDFALFGGLETWSIPIWHEIARGTEVFLLLNRGILNCGIQGVRKNEKMQGWGRFEVWKWRKAWNWRGCARDLARSAFWHRNVWSIPLNKKRNVTNGFGRWLFLLEMVSFCRSSGVHWSSCWSSNFKSIPGNTLHRDNLTSVRNSGCSG